MPNGFGKGRGIFRGGIGFGFRGSSPPWPYIGRGRGGLPRCGYFLSGVASAPVAWPYQWAPYPAYEAPATAPGVTPFAPQMVPEQELDYLKNQADMIKSQLEQIESRMRELEAQGK